MSWRLKYPDFYEIEVEKLENSHIYNQKHFVFKKVLVSSGELLVRRKLLTRYPILIIYPESTPYKPPKIYILKELLSENEVIELSTNQNNISQILQQKKRILYLRHQMTDGDVCFVEFDNLYNDKPTVFNIDDILKRIAIWISGIEKGIIPNDNNEVEFFAHFPQKTYELNILLPEIFYNPDIESGDFYLCRYPRSYNENIITFVGVVINGVNTSGISLLPVKDQIFGALFDGMFNNLLDLLTKRDKLKEEKENKNIIEGSWFNIKVEPTPFSEIKALLKLISSNEEDALNKIYSSKFYEDIFYQFEKTYLGLRFINRRGFLEWAIFQFVRTGENPQIIEKKLEYEDILSNLNNYSIKAVKTYEFTDKSHHLRNLNRADREELKTKSISIIGCGALGSEIADCLGKAGVGNMILIDNESIEPNNPIRHLCGLDSLYLPKVDAVALKLFEHNPFIFLGIIKKNIDVHNSNINQYVNENGIAVSSIADDNTESYLNEQAIGSLKTMYYSRVLRGGKVARIFRVIPGKDACFRCLQLYKSENNTMFIDIPEDKKYPTILNECNNPIRPASAADIKFVASISSRIVIEDIQSEKEFNHWIYYSEPLEHLSLNNDESFKVKGSFIPPNPNCSVCGTKTHYNIRVLVDAFEFMKNEVIKSDKIETGGILIGFKGKNNFIYVLRATGPGPKAKRLVNRFERDIEFCQNILNEEHEMFGDKGIYIGEWHYHPNVSNKPSNIDLMSLSEISEAENYLVNEPIMLIFSNDLRVSATVHPMGKKYYFTEYELIEGNRDEI